MGIGKVVNLSGSSEPLWVSGGRYGNTYPTGSGYYVIISSSTVDEDIWNAILYYGYFKAKCKGGAGEAGANSSTNSGGGGSPGSETAWTTLDVKDGDVFYIHVSTRLSSVFISTNADEKSSGRGGSGSSGSSSFAVAAGENGNLFGGGGGSGGTGYSQGSYGTNVRDYYPGGDGGGGGNSSYIRRVRNGVSSYVLVGYGGGGGGGAAKDLFNTKYDSGGYAGTQGYGGSPGVGGAGFSNHKHGPSSGQTSTNSYSYTNTTFSNSVELQFPTFYLR